MNQVLRLIAVIAALTATNAHAQQIVTVIDFDTVTPGVFLTDPYFEDGFSMELIPHPTAGTLGHYDLIKGIANIDNGDGFPSAVRISMGGARFSLESIDFEIFYALDFGGQIITSTGHSQLIDSLGKVTFDGPDFTNITFFDLAHALGPMAMQLGFDDITVSVPEPTTLGLLGLTCAFCLVRRRPTVL